jgi:SAM-dependent methyltransferase
VDTQPATCVVCSGTAARHQYVVQDLVLEGEGEWPFVLCSACGHGYLDPRPTDSALAAFYASLYTPRNTEIMRRVGESGFERRLQKRRVRAIRRALERVPSRVMDVGAGLGFYLARLAAAFPDAEAIGVDASPQAAEAGSRQGVQILAQPFENLEEQAGSVDVLCMNHLLEHLADPGSFLAKAHALLAEGGILQVEIPRLDGWARRLFGRWYWPHLPPQHLQLFSRQGLEDMIGQHGFQVVSHHTSGYPATVLATLILCVRHTVGSRSRHAGNWLIRLPVVCVGLALLPVALSLDVLLAPVLDRAGGGDILTVVARRL